MVSIEYFNNFSQELAEISNSLDMDQFVRIHTVIIREYSNSENLSTNDKD